MQRLHEKAQKYKREPEDAVTTVVPIPDLVARNGRHHEAVHATWNYPRKLTSTEFFILSYDRSNSILLDQNDDCVGFEGRKIDYDDYAAEHEKPEEKRRKRWMQPWNGF
jgi:hypothetical protein